MPDNVNHPSHYTRGNIEVIDFIEDQNFNYRLGNAVKYICRAGYKDNKVEDLQKAIWYLYRELAAIKKETAWQDEAASVWQGAPTVEFGELNVKTNVDDSDTGVI